MLVEDAFTSTEDLGGSEPQARPRRSPRPGPAAAPLSFLVGVDLGRVTTSLAVGVLQDDGEVQVVETRAERHEGDPLGPFLRLYAELGHEAVLGVVATGAHAERLTPPVVSGLPEEVAQERAAALLWPGHGPMNVARLGGSGFSVLALAGDGETVFEKNDRCSAGAGESVERLCARLGQTLDEAMAMAEESDDAIAVTARCAVFAKSELTHFANQGEPHGKLFRGQFESVAANLHGLFDKVKVAGPTVVVGHGALIRPVVDEFARLADGDVRVPPEAPVFEALGALAFAAGQEWPADAVWPADPAELVRQPRGRIGSLIAAGEGPGEVVRLAEPDPAGSCCGQGRDVGARRRPRPRSGFDWVQSGAGGAGQRPRTGRRLPAHRRQPCGGRGGPGRRTARDERRSGGGHRCHRLGPRRGRHRRAGGLPGDRRPPVRPERDRGPCDRRFPLRPGGRQKLVDRRDRGSGRQVHQRTQRAGRRFRHEPGVQRRHRLVPRGTGGGLRRARHRRVR